MSPNPGILDSLWSLLKNLPYSVRYTLYYEWISLTYKKYPQLAAVHSFCESTCSYIMARLTSDNFKEYGRQIGKMCHTNALIAFSKIIQTIASFSNLSNHFVEATKNMGDLEYDMLIFSIIEALNKSKDKIENGHSFSPKFQSLCKFTGTLLARKPNSDLNGIFQYILCQYSNKSVADLLVLQEIIQSMTGIRVLDDTTDLQFKTLAGGHLLQREGCGFEPLRPLKNSTLCLKIALTKSNNLGLSLGIMMAQLFQSLVYETKETDQIKSLGWLQDTCHKIFLQYFTFVSSQFSPTQYSLMPSLSILIEKYGLEFSTAFHILRPKINHQLWKDIEQKSSSNDMEVDGSIQKSDLQIQLIQSLHEEISSLPIFKKIKLKASFFVTFWQLSVYDIMVPTDGYVLMIDKIKRNIKELEQLLEKNEKNGKKLTSGDKRGLKGDIFNMNETIKNLEKELITQQECYSTTMKRLEVEKSYWFEPEYFGNQESNYSFIQSCIIRRCVLSPGDALYCGKFIYLIHSIGTPHVSTLSLLDQIFAKDVLHAVIFSLTEIESKNFGIFLSSILMTILDWQKDRKVYESNVCFLPGFLKSKPVEGIEIKREDAYDYEEFRKAVNKWHTKLLKCFQLCLLSGQYLHIRNAILVMNKIVKYFPMTVECARNIENAVSKIDDEKRKDLQLMSRSYRATLATYKSTWVSQAVVSGIVTKKIEKLHNIQDSSKISDTTPMISSVDGNSTHLDEPSPLPIEAVMLPIDSDPNVSHQSDQSDRKIESRRESEIEIGEINDHGDNGKNTIITVCDSPVREAVRNSPVEKLRDRNERPDRLRPSPSRDARDTRFSSFRDEGGKTTSTDRRDYDRRDNRNERGSYNNNPSRFDRERLDRSYEMNERRDPDNKDSGIRWSDRNKNGFSPALKAHSRSEKGVLNASLKPDNRPESSFNKSSPNIENVNSVSVKSEPASAQVVEIQGH